MRFYVDCENCTKWESENAALRGELEEIKAGLKEFTAQLQGGKHMIEGLIRADKRVGRSGDWHQGRLDIVDGMLERLRELRLLDPPAGDGGGGE